MTRSINMTRSKRLAKRETEINDQLLPGIPDDITIGLIAPKLPWIDCQGLSSISRGWQRVIRSRQIYHARVGAQSTQAFVVLKHSKILSYYHDNRAIVMYSASDNSCCKLPLIPWHDGKILINYRCISLDNKLYVLGGHESNDCSRSCRTSAKVYMLDLAGQRQWNQCASMKGCRASFWCGVMKGKIYVFGGTFNCEPILDCEVYDPDTDAWSPIARMNSKALKESTLPYEQVTAMGEELLVLGWQYAWPYASSQHVAEAYHPVKDQWRFVNLSIDLEHEHDMVAPILFEMGAKLHKLTQNGIDGYDSCKSSWKPLQRFASGNPLGPFASGNWPWRPLAAVLYNDELLAIVRYAGSHSRKTGLMRIEGLGDEDKEIMWQRTEFPFSSKELGVPYLSIVHL